jgi:hypothetical protein
MTKVDLKHDPLGQALATVAQKKPGSKPTKKVSCWYCGKDGHSAHKCHSRISAGDPVPSAPLKREKDEHTTKGPGTKKPGEARGTF